MLHSSYGPYHYTLSECSPEMFWLCIYSLAVKTLTCWKTWTSMCMCNIYILCRTKLNRYIPHLCILIVFTVKWSQQQWTFLYFRRELLSYWEKSDFTIKMQILYLMNFNINETFGFPKKFKFLTHISGLPIPLRSIM